MLSLFKMSPGRSAAVLFRVPKGEKAVTGPVEKIRVLEKLCSGMNCSAVGRKFKVNESAICSK